ncbi:peptidoglycan editing factor PgeF [Ureibacillus sp. FSL K6-8385]|uniref:Purine nucleoside phosphorylase n=1 Tax=Ureibacillus terrenus TaxID=118246 RepID=A0A540V2U7_9BACL|nr:peptidoglycan editing factor PgeF [Ureibacillus terrenus]MED3661659.1 peptidoglycan editing factor PgeF [Ureibacillus terrenus]MED3763560.1 peptidoglycan editing factor PgeF [Ureibacillus terrenus]TQE91048.1 peptidoglycan editing factor PgeF [Ureibacillus terrenus]
MTTKIYFNNDRFIAGITLKNEGEAEQNNMALHVCENPADVIENRKKLACFIGCDLRQFVCANQTHSDHVYKVTAQDCGRGAFSSETAIPDTDALYTTEPNIVLCTFTADCVPVIFYSEKDGIIGVIHSGWQGTVKEITRKVFGHIQTNEHCNMEDFHVHIGTAISQEKFEVDEDVYAKFKNLGYANEFIYFNEKTGKYHIDNQQTVKKQCELSGIPSDQIAIDSTCTFKNPQGFSYRENKKAGRHLTFIMKKA